MRLNAGKSDGCEVVTGALACGECGLEYSITGGILDALAFPDPVVEAARQAYRRSKVSQSGQSPEGLANRAHLDQGYLRDTEANFRQMLGDLEPSSGWALDIGAGTGWTTAGLARKGFLAVAVDISADNKLELACHHFGSGLYFDRVLADMNRLPFRDRSFTLTLSSAALHHSSDLNISLREISRTMVPGGRLELVNEPARGLLESWLPGRGGLEADEGVLENHHRFGCWMKSLKGAGFTGRVRFPESIASRLAERDFSRQHKFHRMAGMVAGLWGFGPARAVLKKLLFRPGMHLLGLPLCYSGRKSEESASCPSQ
jgi:SAM-dependent methyltransferase